MAGIVKDAKLKVRMLHMQPHLKQIETLMHEYVRSDNGCHLLEQVCSEFFSSGGKRFRPMLCLLSCMSLDGRIEAAVNVAVASELFHSMSLIHDDIIDNDDTRRGRPTVHVVHGLDTAILSGDYLLAKAFEALCDCAAYLPPHNFERVIRLFSETCTEACAGEIFDVKFDYSCDADYYRKVIECKTARLIVTNLQAGALCAGASEDELEAFAGFGYSMGMSFQIMDDVIGLTSSEKELGKTVGLDLTRGRPNIVAILAAQKNNEVREMLEAGLSLQDVPGAILRFKALGCIEEATAMAQQATREAKGSLRGLRASTHKEMLLELADYVVERRT